MIDFEARHHIDEVEKRAQQIIDDKRFQLWSTTPAYPHALGLELAEILILKGVKLLELTAPNTWGHGESYERVLLDFMRWRRGTHYTQARVDLENYLARSEAEERERKRWDKDMAKLEEAKASESTPGTVDNE